VPRDQYERALKRAEQAEQAQREAERRAGFPARAISLGVPVEFAGDWTPT
jgi:hypothetical protein